jgi:XTP/dITP diphosphohydrolase
LRLKEVPTQSRRTLVVATHNRGKLGELSSLLAGLPIEVRSVGDVVPDPPRVVEDGGSFASNAIKKAQAAAEATGLLSLADDSGLEVDALDGQPGVRSARFAREGATDAENNAALLAALHALDDSLKPPIYRARFRCVLALVDPLSNGTTFWTVTGVCEGTITCEPRGSGGFGYDPLFVLAGTNKTMAELERDQKNQLSHRGHACSALRSLLARLLAERGLKAAL